MKVNIEQKFFGNAVCKKIGKRACKGGVDHDVIFEAIGSWMLVKIWRQSQAQHLLHASAEQILDWAGIDSSSLDDPENHWLIEILVDSMFLKNIDDNEYYIAGNRDKIRAQLEYLARYRRE